MVLPHNFEVVCATYVVRCPGTSLTSRSQADREEKKKWVELFKDFRGSAFHQKMPTLCTQDFNGKVIFLSQISSIHTITISQPIVIAPPFQTSSRLIQLISFKSSFSSRLTLWDSNLFFSVKLHDNFRCWKKTSLDVDGKPPPSGSAWIADGDGCRLCQATQAAAHRCSQAHAGFFLCHGNMLASHGVMFADFRNQRTKKTGDDLKINDKISK